MSIRFAAWIAWSVCLLCVVLAAASLILALLNGRTLGEIFLAWDGPSVASLEHVMNLGENRIEMRIPRSAWVPRDLRSPHS